MLSALALFVSGLACLPAFGQGFIVKGRKANAEIVIAEARPRMATLAALELQYYVEKISGARLPIVTAPTPNGALAIYVGRSAHTERLGVTDEGLRHGAFRMVSGPDYLVLLGHDFDFVPPEPWPVKRSDKARAEAEWDRKVGDRWEGDSVILLLAPPGHDHYYIEVAPDGRVFDADRMGRGRVETRWKSMTEVETERGKDYWRVKIRVPLALVGKEDAEGDPYNYIVAPPPGPGTEWFFNIARRRPRPGDRRPTTYSFAPVKAYSLHAPGSFAKLRFE